MSIDQNKQYKIGPHVFTWRGDRERGHSPTLNTYFHWPQMDALVNEGLATEVEEPMVRTAVIEFNSCGHISSMRPYTRQWFNINEEEAKNSTWDIVATRRPK